MKGLIFLMVITTSLTLSSQDISIEDFKTSINLLGNHDLSTFESLLISNDFTIKKNLDSYSSDGMYVLVDKSYVKQWSTYQIQKFDLKIEKNKYGLIFMTVSFDSKSYNEYLPYHYFQKVNRFAESHCNECSITPNEEPRLFSDGTIGTAFGSGRVKNYENGIPLVGEFTVTDYTISVVNFIAAIKKNTYSTNPNWKVDPEHTCEFFYKMTICKDGNFSQTSDGIEIPVNSIGNHSYIELKIGGKSESYMIDSGASYTTISQEKFEYLRDIGIIRIQDIKDEVLVSLADNSTKAYTKVIIPIVEISGYKIENVEVLVTDGSNLVGQSIFQKFNNWEIDNVRNKLVLK